ncbi:selenium metabolism-associated LysR family transcriptional regulator [Neobacillus mesonae]|uniref:selenium metabolism-associated LysR family transcriptional regulator n=1 Tax=Neobacillus mesonae TaxID=1193713 RepID=UPI00203C1CF5|nr:selenium metabolism-associated LysR family transcriptional regulator [Neobacillus mesonae]MCM3571112.1 selenium metabolism-associated LysR family transcriptional regulator [Neobacillus mesonae]
MNIDHLKVFHILAGNGSFSNTSKVLHMSQSNVSKQIRHLEEELNTKLFDRTKKKVQLTSQGKILLESTEKIFKEINFVKNKLASLSETVHGDLVIGASITLGEHVLPYILVEYQKQYSNVHLEMKVDNSEHIIEKLRNQQVHIAFIQSSSYYPEFKQQLFLEDELVIIAPQKFIKPEFDSLNEYITPNMLLNLPMIIREKGSGTRQIIEEQLRNNRLDPNKLNVVLELENTESIKAAVESGMGISVISKTSIQKELRLNTLRILSVKGMQLKRNFYSVYDEQNLSFPSNSFLSFIHHYYNQM